MNLDSLRSLANLLALAARQAWGHRRRTLLVALVVSLGNAALVFQLAQGHGQAQNVAAQHTTLMAQQISEAHVMPYPD